MTRPEFWTLVIVGGSAVSAMLIVALRMVLQQRTSPALS